MTTSTTIRATLTVFMTAAVLLAPAGPTGAVVADVDAEAVRVERIAGATRYDTSAALATRVCQAYATGYLSGAVADPADRALTVYVASGATYADGLSVAGNLGLTGPPIDYPNRSDATRRGRLAGPGPLLLTDPDRLRPETRAALDQIQSICGLRRVVVVGGPAAVSVGIENDLRARYGDVERFGGATRYATSIELAARLALERSSDAVRAVLGPLTTAILTTGTNFPDALAAGALATRQRLPILLNSGGRLRSDVANYLIDNSITEVVIVGGLAVVPAAVEGDLRAAGIAVTRIAGPTRYDTAALLATRYAPATTEIVLTTGETFPDALSVSGFAAVHAAPVLLSTPDRLSTATAVYLGRVGGADTRLWVVGGETSVGSADVAQAADALNG